MKTKDATETITRQALETIERIYDEMIRRKNERIAELEAERDSLKSQLGLQVTYARLVNEMKDDLEAENAKLKGESHEFDYLDEHRTFAEMFPKNPA